MNRLRRRTRHPQGTRIPPWRAHANARSMPVNPSFFTNRLTLPCFKNYPRFPLLNDNAVVQNAAQSCFYADEHEDLDQRTLMIRVIPAAFVSNVPRTSKRAPHVRTSRFSPQFSAKESAHDSRLSRSSCQVQPSCRQLYCQGIPVSRSDFHDFALAFLWPRLPHRRLPAARTEQLVSSVA